MLFRLLNVAVAAAQNGARVCVLDANPGLSNIDVLCGINSYWNLSHVLTGAKSLGDAIIKGPAGINLVSGASGLIDPCACPRLPSRWLRASAPIPTPHCSINQRRFLLFIFYSLVIVSSRFNSKFAIRVYAANSGSAKKSCTALRPCNAFSIPCLTPNSRSANIVSRITFFCSGQLRRSLIMLAT